MQNNFYSSLKSLARIVVILLFVGIGVDVINIGINLIQLIFFPDLGDHVKLSSSELILSLTALAIVVLNFVVFIATVVVFLMWLHRAYKNLSILSRHSTEATPGWAVGYWFIPFLNLVKPLRIVNEVWHASNPENIESDFSYSDTSSPALHGFWWASWLISNILANIGSRLVFGTNDNTIQNIGTLMVILANVFSSVAAVLLIKVVRNITERQELSGSKILFQAPPMPPTFNQDFNG